MSDLHKKLIKENPAFRQLPPKPSSSTSNLKRDQRNKKDYTVLPWSNYFSKMEDFKLENGNLFRCYIAGDSGPVFLFLHGGGFSGLSWSILSSILVKKIKCQCYSVDIRGHGDTKTNDDEDLSIETLSYDIKMLIETIWKNDSPPICLVGHSMGGALAVHAATKNNIKNLIALVVIDVVEGSAMDALSSMQTYLQGRPKIFNSIEQAIEYSVRCGSIRNIESARVSIIGQLRKLIRTDSSDPTQSTCTENVFQNLGSQSHAVLNEEIVEEDEENSESTEIDSNKVDNEKINEKNEFIAPLQCIDKYIWRIDLTKTEKFWKDWFKGLSSMFLNVHVPKLLLLAGVDRLDRELMIGQMQGKFQMQVLPLCGHAVHEDSPEEVADALSNFMVRLKLAEQLDQINSPKLCC